MDRSFFTKSPIDCARELIGCQFRHGGVGGVIVETEAYLEHGDAACHTFSRPAARRFVEEKPVGTGYVYLNYGMHWLVNVLIKGRQGNGFVLLRALEPRWGIAVMKERRQRQALTDLCSGPGKLSVSLGMDGRHHGRSIARKFSEGGRNHHAVEAGPRIGISREQEAPWRFVAKGNRHLSRP